MPSHPGMLTRMLTQTADSCPPLHAGGCR